MNKKILLLVSRKNALLLAAFGTVCTLFVTLTYMLTKPAIEQQERLQVLKNLQQVLQPEKYDNVPIENCVKISDEQLFGNTHQQTVYRAYLDNAPYAVVFQTQTIKGYNGLIKMLLAVDINGVVQGVRVLAHQETPGLGDKIELAKSDWILSFDNQSVKSADDKRWFVKKDGGNFDQFTGATITPRSIVNHLRTTVFFSQEKVQGLFSAENQCAVTATAAPQEQNDDNT